MKEVVPENPNIWQFNGCFHIFTGILGPVQTVQRAECVGELFLLLAYSGIHIGIMFFEELPPELLRATRGATPSLKDGDLLAIMYSMIEFGGWTLSTSPRIRDMPSSAW